MLIMMIIIDDLHDYFNLDNYHDCWLIGDHMMMTWVVIMIMPIDMHCLLLIDYDEKHDWWFIDDNWLWMMNDKDHRWWFIIDNDKSWMITDWQTDWLIDWWQYHDYKICHNSSSQRAI